MNRGDRHDLGMLGGQRDDAIVARLNLRRPTRQRLIDPAEPHRPKARYVQPVLTKLFLVSPKRLPAIPQMNMRIEEGRLRRHPRRQHHSNRQQRVAAAQPQEIGDHDFLQQTQLRSTRS